ncbi:hypothetical protein [Acidocella sp. KAb 2-4]|uniref:hypothetical protein n=1 Tax=Acidocella sp. KAb 2-4 TaxID=2885158 RepID=UPI001D097E23|nr:hypothetical protein [Acidocella sp. KAb 2-4]MCB5946041.1 hypothetical protein [Acidocella sp. KAb 2-4]
MPPTITIPTNGPAYLPGARLLAILAYPPASDADQKWRRAELAICRAALLVTQELDPDWAKREQTIIPEHLLYPATDLTKQLDKIATLHRHRLGTAQVAMPMLKQALRVAQGAPAENRRNATLDSRIQHVLEGEEARKEWLSEQQLTAEGRFPEDDHNFENRVFRLSLPVLHLAAALAVAIDRSQKEFRRNPAQAPASAKADIGGLQIHTGHLLTEPELVRWIINAAIEYEGLLPLLKKPAIKDFVRLRMSETA